MPRAISVLLEQVTRARMQERQPPRATFLAVILLGHVAAIYLFAVRVDSPNDELGAELLALPILLIPSSVQDGEVPLDRDEADTLEHAALLRQHAAIILREPTQEGAAASMASSEPESAPREQIDWKGQAEQMARKWAEPNATPKGFGSTKQGDEPAEAPARNIFENSSPRRAGYIEMIEPGVERRWLSKQCYREFGWRPDRVAGVRMNLNPITCVGRSVRDDLFDHLKPEYLKHQE